jgi:hypothetical protein
MIKTVPYKDVSNFDKFDQVKLTRPLPVHSAIYYQAIESLPTYKEVKVDNKEPNNVIEYTEGSWLKPNTVNYKEILQTRLDGKPRNCVNPFETKYNNYLNWVDHSNSNRVTLKLPETVHILEYKKKGYIKSVQDLRFKRNVEKEKSNLALKKITLKN